MSAETQHILDQALRLPASDRAALADVLLSSLHQPDEALDARWVAEAASRLRAFNDGEMEAIAAEDVFAEFDMP